MRLSRVSFHGQAAVFPSFCTRNLIDFIFDCQRGARSRHVVDRWAIVVFWIRRIRVQGTLQRRAVERLWDEDNQSSNVFTAIDPDVDDGSWNCRLA